MNKPNTLPSPAPAHPIDWVRIEKYCDWTGETPASVRNKRVTGIWPEGVIWEKKADGVIWYNWKEINKWLTTSNQRP